MRRWIEKQVKANRGDVLFFGSLDELTLFTQIGDNHAASRESRRAVPRSADKGQRSRRRPGHCVGRGEQGLEYVRREVTYDRHNDAVTGEVVGFVVIGRQLVIVG